MLRALTQPDRQYWLIAVGILSYLAAFYIVWKLGFIYATPLLFLLPVIGWYLFQSLLKPILLLVPMLGATYLGNVVSVIPEGTVPLTLFQLFLLLGILIYFLHYLLHSDQKFRVLGFELELLLILTLISFTIIYTPNREDALLNLTRIIFLIILAYLIANIASRQIHFYAVFFLLTLIGIILGSLSVQTSLLDPVTTVMNIQSGGSKIFGRGALTIEDPNIFATLFFLPVAFTTSVFLSQQRLSWRIPALGVLLVLLLGLASTYSRSAWVSSAFLLLMLVIYYRQYKMVVLVFSAVLLIIVSVPELRNLTTGLFNRLLDIFSGSSDDSSKIRILLGTAGIYMFFDSWMLGVGFRGFPEKFTNYFTTQESIGVVEAHNVVYEILAELGIVGFGLFLVLAIMIVRKAAYHVRISQTETDKIIATTLISTLTAYLIFFQFYGGALVSTNLWALVGLIIAQGYYLNNNRTSLKT